MKEDEKVKHPLRIKIVQRLCALEILLFFALVLLVFVVVVVLRRMFFRSPYVSHMAFFSRRMKHIVLFSEH